MSDTSLLVWYAAAALACLVIGFIFGAKTRAPRRPPILVPIGERAVLMVSKGCCVDEDAVHVFDGGELEIIVDESYGETLQ